MIFWRFQQAAELCEALAKGKDEGDHRQKGPWAVRMEAEQRASSVKDDTASERKLARSRRTKLHPPPTAGGGVMAAAASAKHWHPLANHPSSVFARLAQPPITGYLPPANKSLSQTDPFVWYFTHVSISAHFA